MKKDPSPQAAQAFEEAQKALGDDQPGSFQTAAVAFFAADTGGSVLAYPGVRTLEWELTYNRWQPFMWSWIAMVVALAALLVSMALQARPSSKWWYRFGLAVYGVSLAIQTGGFVSRIVISERAPVGNMYETVIWASFMAAVLALVLECIYRRKVIALAGAGVAALGLILADHTPLALDPAISPLAPVLRTNYWLTVHVLTITSAYAAATLAWGLGNLSLVLLTFGKGGDRRRETLKTLSQFTYRAMQVTVLLLAAGTFLGGWWAAEAWGRFWGWDPKEVGALIALISYVVPLHARYLGWVREFGLALSAVLCYATVILSWYVVNFVFASGLHSYGFGDEQGMVWVLWAGLLNLEWVLIAAGLYLAKPRHSQFNGPQINGPASP